MAVPTKTASKGVMQQGEEAIVVNSLIPIVDLLTLIFIDLFWCQLWNEIKDRI